MKIREMLEDLYSQGRFWKTVHGANPKVERKKAQADMILAQIKQAMMGCVPKEKKPDHITKNRDYAVAGWNLARTEMIKKIEELF